eukprot:1415823-Rhodomonas_salina.1
MPEPEEDASEEEREQERERKPENGEVLVGVKEMQRTLQREASPAYVTRAALTVPHARALTMRGGVASTLNPRP